jgi:hypothetical protein
MRSWVKPIMAPRPGIMGVALAPSSLRCCSMNSIAVHSRSTTYTSANRVAAQPVGTVRFSRRVDDVGEAAARRAGA